MGWKAIRLTSLDAEERSFDVLLTTYWPQTVNLNFPNLKFPDCRYSFFERDSESQRHDRDFFRKFPWEYLVIDEVRALAPLPVPWSHLCWWWPRLMHSKMSAQRGTSGS